MYLCEIIKRKEFKCPNGVHPNDSLLIVLEGSFQCSFEESTYHARQNDVFVFRRDTPFKRRVTEPLECIYIQFDAFPIPLDNGIMTLSDPSRAQSTISLLKKSILSGEQAKVRHYTNDLFLLNQSSTEDDAPINATVSKCKAFLHENYADPITLDALAHRFYISKQWLILSFKAETGKTPIEYLNGIRLNQAQNLLKHTERPIGEIAAKCGFYNIYYFSNAFKKRVGLSPKEYRKKLQL